jgi:hypothetical protein
MRIEKKGVLFRMASSHPMHMDCFFPLQRRISRRRPGEGAGKERKGPKDDGRRKKRRLQPVANDRQRALRAGKNLYTG